MSFVSGNPYAVWPSVGSKTAPAELVLAQALHVVAPALLLHAISAPRAPDYRLQCLQLCHFLRRPGVSVVFVALASFMPLAAVSEAGPPPALAAS
jgi:hypothetical protein